MKCDCGKDCQPLPVHSRSFPNSSEWYCSKCHKSYDMSEEDYQRCRQAGIGVSPVAR